MKPKPKFFLIRSKELLISVTSVKDFLKYNMKRQRIATEIFDKVSDGFLCISENIDFPRCPC